MHVANAIAHTYMLAIYLCLHIFAGGNDESNDTGSASFVVDLAIRGYHIYKDIWPSPLVEEQLAIRATVGVSIWEFTRPNVHSASACSQS